MQLPLQIVRPLCISPGLLDMLCRCRIRLAAVAGCGAARAVACLTGSCLDPRRIKLQPEGCAAAAASLPALTAAGPLFGCTRAICAGRRSCLQPSSVRFKELHLTGLLEKAQLQVPLLRMVRSGLLLPSLLGLGQLLPRAFQLGVQLAVLVGDALHALTEALVAGPLRLQGCLHLRMVCQRLVQLLSQGVRLVAGCLSNPAGPVQFFLGCGLSCVARSDLSRAVTSVVPLCAGK